MKIVFEERAVTRDSFTGIVVGNELRLPAVFRPLCETQEIEEAEDFLAFVRKDPTTTSILLRSRDTREYVDACDSLERIIRSRPHKSADLTPTAPSVDAEADTPVSLDVLAHNETTAA